MVVLEINICTDEEAVVRVQERIKVDRVYTYINIYLEDITLSWPYNSPIPTVRKSLSETRRHIHQHGKIESKMDVSLHPIDIGYVFVCNYDNLTSICKGKVTL